MATDESTAISSKMQLVARFIFTNALTPPHNTIAPVRTLRPSRSRLSFTLSIGKGDHFGELSILADIPRQATVRASSVCLLVSISREPFRNLMEQLPEFGNTVQSVMKHYMLSR